MLVNARFCRKLPIAILAMLGPLCAAAESPSPSPSPCSLQAIKDWVEQNRIYSVLAPHYPPTARGLGQKGRLIANVTLNPERRIESAFLRYPSGQKELDEGVLDMILGKAGTRLGAPSCAKDGEKFSFDIPLNFQFNEGNTAAKRELILEYIRASNSLEAVSLMAPGLTHKLFGLLREKYPKATPEALAVIEQEVKQVMRQEMGEGSHYLEKVISLHQQYFTEDDIKNLIAFNRTELGRKVAKVTPLIVVEMQTYSEQWGKGIALLLVDHINARYRQKGLPYEIGPATPTAPQDKRPADARQVSASPARWL